MKFLNLFKPAPHIKEIEDKKVVNKKYRYWRLRTFYSMYLGYAFFYFCRESFPTVLAAVSTSLNMGKAKLGLILSITSLAYGASKFFSGIISDRSNPRYFMAFGLIITGILNICFGLSSTFVLFAVVWGLNGWFQGWGWPPCGKLLTHWYSQKERGSWWSMWNTAHNFGAALISLFGGLIVEKLGWRFGMYIPGSVSILIGLFLINRLRDTPRSLGLPTIEKFKNDFPDNKHERDRVRLSTKEILVKYILKNKYIWLLAVAYFFIYIVRKAVHDWTISFLVETKGYSYFVAGASIWWFEVGGFLGSLVAGWGSDFIFKGRRGPINVIFTFMMLICIYLMWKVPGGLFIIDYMFIFLIGFFVFGPQMLIGIAATDVSHKDAVGSATGFIGWIAYIGAALAGGPLGKTIDTYGWNGFFYILVVCAFIALLFLMPLWKIKTNPNLRA